MYEEIINKSIFVCVSIILLSHCPAHKASALRTIKHNNSVEFIKMLACNDEYHNQTLTQQYDDDTQASEIMNKMNLIIKPLDRSNHNNYNNNNNSNKWHKNMKWLGRVDEFKNENFNIGESEMTSGDYRNNNIINDGKFYSIHFNKNIKKQQIRHESVSPLKDEANCPEKRKQQQRRHQKNNVINILQSQFIRQFAIKYKQISHVTFFTCRKQSLLPLKGQNDTMYLHSLITLEEMIFFKYLYNPSDIMETYKYPESMINLTKTMQYKQQQQQQPLFKRDNRISNLMLKIIQIDHLLEDTAQRPQHQQQQSSCFEANRNISSKKCASNNNNERRTIFTANWLDDILISSSTSKQIVIVNMECSQAGRKLLEMASKRALFNARHHWLLLENEKHYFVNWQSKVNENGRVKNDKAKVIVQSSVKNDGNNSTESMEKFLAKLNININTELILAKLHKTQQFCTKTTNEENQNYADSNISIPSCVDYCYNLYDVWNPGQQYGGKLNITLIGNFTLQHGLQLRNSYRLISTVRRRTNMKLAQIRCMIVLIHRNRTDTLEHYLTNPYDPHIDSMNRFNYALISLVRDMFNFSMLVAPISSWGYLKNGKFDGMIGALIRNRTDIGGSPIFFRLERAKVIDYTIGTWTARPCFIFRHPRSTNKDRIVFLQPFTESVWLYTTFLASFTIILLWILTALERDVKSDEKRNSAKDFSRKHGINNDKATQSGHLQQHLLPWPIFRTWWNYDCDNNDMKKSNGKLFRINLFLEAFLFYIGSICQQGLSYSTKFFSGRCIVVTSILFSFAIYQFYLASIVGTLLMEKPKTIRTLKDLIQTSLDIGIEDIPYNRDYFLRTKDPVAQELYARKVTHVPNSTGDKTHSDGRATAQVIPIMPSNMSKAAKAKIYRDILHSHETGAHAKTNDASNWYEPEYGVQKIKHGHFAFHVDVATAYKIIVDTFTEKEICDLTEIELFPVQKMMSIVQKNSPLRKMMSYGLRRAMEVGLVDYQRKIWHSPKPNCVKQLHTEDLQVDLQTFTSALLLFIFGCILSLLILALEIIYYKLQQHRLSKM